MKRMVRRNHNYKIPIAIITITLLIDSSVILFMRTKKIDDPKDYDYIAKYAGLLNEKVSVVNSVRESFYQNQNTDFYLDTLNERVSEFEELIANYTEALDDVANTYKRVEKQCNRIYADAKTNEFCDTMKINYESANNYYVDDINMYNKFIDAYNSNIENDDNSSKEQLNAIVLKYDYIDVNQDKTYVGNEGE